MNEEFQEIYINMDDSGQLHTNDNICIYGGIVFIDKETRQNFIHKYRKIINRIKCKYCKGTRGNCKFNCPEIKDTNSFMNHKRQILMLVKKEFCFALKIDNQKVNSDIMQSKLKRGRFRDYTQKIIIKKILQKLITNNKIDPNKPVKLIIRIDQQGTSTDTGRIFVNDIYNELIHGTYNYNFNLIFKPILFSKLEIDLKYVISHKHECIQASDFIAGETRKILSNRNLSNDDVLKKLEFLDVRSFFP